MRTFRSSVLITFILGACGDKSAPDLISETTEAQQSLLPLTTSYTPYMQSLAPKLWLRLDETSGTVAADSSGNGLNGTYTFTTGQYIGPTFGVSGVTGFTGGAVHFETPGKTAAGTFDNGYGYYGPHVTVPDHPSLSLTQLKDEFTRSMPLGTSWGQNWLDGGDPSITVNWLATGAPQSVFQVDDGVGASILANGGTGSWGQYVASGNQVSYERVDSDVSVQVRWDASTSAFTSGSVYPLILATRYQDANNYYAARLSETSTGAVQVSVVQKIAGVQTLLKLNGQTTAAPITLATSYDHGANSYWRLRFVTKTRADGTGVDFEVRAWLPPAKQPFKAAAITSTTTNILTSKGFAIIGSNSSSNAYRGVFNYKKFRVQAPGLSVSAWMRPMYSDFSGVQGALCPTGTQSTSSPPVKEGYVHWLGKQRTGYNNEYIMRLYPETAKDVCLRTSGLNGPTGSTYAEDRLKAVSAYHYKNEKPGAGHRKNGAGVVGEWHHYVALYDSGDFEDYEAGVTLCRDGVCTPVKSSSYTSISAANYAHPDYQIDPQNTFAPFRVGAVNQAPGVWLQFQGDIDEVSVFDYLLSNDQVERLYLYGASGYTGP